MSVPLCRIKSQGYIHTHKTVETKRRRKKESVEFICIRWRRSEKLVRGTSHFSSARACQAGRHLAIDSSAASLRHGRLSSPWSGAPGSYIGSRARSWKLSPPSAIKDRSIDFHRAPRWRTCFSKRWTADARSTGGRAALQISQCNTLWINIDFDKSNKC